jgi:hypothetical protein
MSVFCVLLLSMRLLSLSLMLSLLSASHRQLG